jgi:ABC-type dipeptide/oligopeptide/nickel transport system ATPase component
VGLKVENHTAYYQTLHGNVQALEGATFYAADKESIGVSGESGCRASTLSDSLIYMQASMKYIQGSVTLNGEVFPIQHLDKKNSEFASGRAYFGGGPVADNVLSCDKYRPILSELEEDHFVACYRYNVATQTM